MSGGSTISTYSGRFPDKRLTPRRGFTPSVKATMSRTLAALVMGALLSGLAPEAQAQSAEVLYQRALRKEQVQGDLDAAIKLFRQVVAAGDRALAARALVRIGRSYERLGRAGAEGPYRRVLAQFPDQSEAAAQARARLITLARTAASAASRVALRLVAAAEDISEGQVSPDGRMMAQIGGTRGITGTDISKANLVVQDLASGSRRQLTHKTALEFADRPVWSPDGRRIAYAWTTILEPTTELRAIGLDGSGMTTLFRAKEVLPWAWSADARQILTAVRRDKTVQLVLVPVAGGAPRVLDSFPDWPSGAGFSPDQRWIAYSSTSRRAGGERNLFARSIDGDRKVTLVDHPAEDRFLGWTAEGILFVSDRRGTTDLFLQPFRQERPAGGPVLLKARVGGISPAGFDRKGAFYYQNLVSIIDVFTRPIDPSTGRAVGDSALESAEVEGKSLMPDWSPDGEHFAYLAFVGPAEAPTVVVRKESTREQRRVELPLGVEPYVLRVAPGGGRALLGTWPVGIVDLANRTYDTLPVRRDEGGTSYHYPVWSVDGRRIFYTTSGSLVALEVVTGQERELYRAAGSRHLAWPAVSPDGRVVAFAEIGGTSPTSSALVVIGADGGEARQLVRLDPGWPVPIVFSPDSRHLIYTARRLPPDNRPEVAMYRIPVTGGEPELLEIPVDMETFRFLRVRPDGRRIAFTHDHTLTEVWVLEDFTPPRRGDR